MFHKVNPEEEIQKAIENNPKLENYMRQADVN